MKNDIEADDEVGRPAPGLNQWTIWLNAPITRRKSYHIVSNPKGEIMFNSMNVTECLQFLEDHDISSWRLCSETKTWGVARQYCYNRGGQF